jgi:hypothetical protein
MHFFRGGTVLAVAIGLLIPFTAHAQQPTTATAPPTTTVEAPTGAATAPADDTDQRLLVALALVLCPVLVGGILIYLSSVQRRAYDSIDKAISSGDGIPDASPVDPFPSSDRSPGSVTSAQLKIEGPGVTAVGTATRFAATRAGRPVSVSWSVIGTGAGADAQTVSIAPAEGEATAVRAMSVGTYQLTAADGSGAKATVGFSAIALARSKPRKLAFVGEGWGTIAIAFVVLTLAAALALARVLDGSATAALFGSVLGYIFLKAAQNSTARPHEPGAGEAAS